MARGRPPFEPTEEDRKKVSLAAGLGTPHEQICNLVLTPKGTPICKDTLYKYFEKELGIGKAETHLRVGGSIVKAALAGNMTAAIFYAKTQMGWKETSVVENTPTGPVEYEISIVEEYVQAPPRKD